MEYYGLASALKKGIINPENVNDSMFEYLLLNRGLPGEVANASGIDENKLMELKKIMTDRFPIDINIAGSEHKDVHFPFSLFTHAALLPETLFPKEYLLTSHLTINGEKMSKSRGNVLYLDELIETVKKNPIEGISPESSLDAIRFFLMSYQSLDRDFDWSDKTFISSGINRVKRYINFVEENSQLSNGNPKNARLNTSLDKWMMTKLQRTTEDTSVAMSSRKFREAIIHIDELGKDLYKYLAIPEHDLDLASLTLKDQLSMMYPFIPRISRELHKKLFNDEKLSWPCYQKEMQFPEDHDKIEHEFHGEKYINFLTGELKKSLEIAKGKGLYVPSKAKAIFPSEYSAKILKDEAVLENLLEKIPIEINNNTRFPHIK